MSVGPRGRRVRGSADDRPLENSTPAARRQSTDTSQLGALVLDPAHKATLLINDRKQEYLDAGMFTSLVTATFGPVLRFFRPAGAGDPCTQWNTTTMPFASLSHTKSDALRTSRARASDPRASTDAPRTNGNGRTMRGMAEADWCVSTTVCRS